MRTPKTKNSLKRVLVISDLHCGHWVGLCPPDYHMDCKWNEKFSQRQKQLWRFYADTIKSLGSIDILIVNGDSIDGKGLRSGSTEQMTADQCEQVAIAAECINFVGAKKVFMTYGTPYHTGADADWEDQVAKEVKNLAEITGHLFLDVNGCKLDAKHFISSSSIPHGRHTAIARAKMWNAIWGDRQPQADIMIRSHVHYYAEAAGRNWRGLVTPALQHYGSKYGVRRCEGTVDIGMIVLDVEKDGQYKYGVMLEKSPLQQIQATVA